MLTVFYTGIIVEDIIIVYLFSMIYIWINKLLVYITNKEIQQFRNKRRRFTLNKRKNVYSCKGVTITFQV